MSYAPNIYPLHVAAQVPPATLTLLTSSLPTAYVGVAYTATLEAEGGTAPFAWDFAAGTLPAWATLNASTTATTTITGTPTSGDVGATAITPRVTDSATPTPATDTNGSLTLTVEEVPTALTVTTSSLPAVTRGQSYSATVNASGGTPPYTWNLVAPNNVLPGGITRTDNVLDATQVTQAGSFPLVFRVTDAVAATADSGLLTLVVDQVADLTIDTPAVLSGEVGTAYSRTLTTSGGWGTKTWIKTAGSYPPGVSLVAGELTGTPTTAEAYTFTLQVEDSEARVASRTFTFTVVAAGTLELPYDYFDEWSTHGTLYKAQDFRLSAAGLQALQNTPSATGGPWVYDFAGDTYPDKQDAMKLDLDITRASDGQQTWNMSTAYQLYIPITPALTAPDKVLMSWDWYWGPEFFDNSGNVYGYKMWQVRPGRSNGLWTLCHSRTVEGWRYVDAVRSNVRSAQSIPNGMIDAGNDRIVPLGAGVAYSQAKYINAYPVTMGLWTRYWVEIRFARPHTEFTSWNAEYGVTLQPNIDDMSGQGRWHMLSMWAANENASVERLMYQIPMGWWGRGEGDDNAKVIDSGTLDSLVDAQGNLGNTNARVGQEVLVKFADGSREYRIVSANTSTSITVSVPFSQVPQAGDTYWTDHWEPEITHFTYEINTSKCCPIGPVVGYARPFMAFKNYPLSDADPESDPIFRKPVR